VVPKFTNHKALVIKVATWFKGVFVLVFEFFSSNYGILIAINNSGPQA